MNSNNHVKSKLLPIYIVKKDATGTKELGRRKINFQINAGNVYRISYKFFMPKGYRLAKDSKPDYDCRYNKNGLNLSSITFTYVKKSQAPKPKPQPEPKPIHVSYIDTNTNERVKAGSATGNYGQTVNVLDQVSMPSGYRLYDDQQAIFKVNDKDQSVDLMVKKQSIPHQVNAQPVKSSDDESHADSSQVHSDPVANANDVTKGIQTLESNLQKYDCDIAVQLIHEVLTHNLDFFKQVVQLIFSKMKYKDINNLKTDSQEQKVSGVVKKCLHNKNQINFTFIRAKKDNIKHEVTVSEVRDFVTSVMDHNSSKGVFITTSRFTRDARKEAERHSIILIDDMKLAHLMMQNNIGVKPQRIFRIVNLDRDFFN